MTKLCGSSVYKPYLVIFNDCLNEGQFPHEWKKANVLPVHVKRNRVRKTIGLSLYYVFVAKCLIILFLTSYCLLFF